MKKREFFDLSLVLVVSIFFSLFSISINFIDRFNKFFYTYTKLPIAEFLLHIIFLWLAGLLWVTFRNWRKAIKRQKELEDIIGSIRPDVLMVIDSNRKIIMCNNSVKRIFGYEVNEVINQKTDFLYFDRRHEPSQKHEIYNMLEMIGFHQGLAKGKKKNGSTVSLEITTTKLSGREGAVLLLREMSEREKAAREIREAKEFSESIIENSRDGIVIVDEKGYIVSANNSFAEMSKFNKEELIGQHVSFLAIEDKDLKKEVLEKTGELFEKGFIFYESKHRVKGGGCIEVECNCSMIKNDDGNFTAGVAIIRDITERKKFEKELKTSEEKYRSLIENANDVIISVNEEGTIISFNKKAEKMFGYSRDEILGKSIVSITHPSRRKLQEKYLEKLNTPHNLSGEIREGKVLGKNGQEYPVEVVTYAIELHDEVIYTSIMRDISERKKADKETKEARDFLANVIESSRDAIFITDVKGTILSVNSAGERLYGLSKDDMVGKHISLLATSDNSTKEQVRERLEELYEKGFVSIETRHITKDGNCIDVESNLSLMVDSEGNNIGGVSIIRDVTERKKFEETLKVSEEKYHSLIENANDAVVSLNEEGSLLEFNKKAEEMFGYSRSEVLGESILLLNTPSEKEKSIKEFKRFKETRQFNVAGKTIERELLKKDENVFIGECSTFTTELQGKHIFTTFIRDITERKEMQDKLLQSEKLKSLGELAGGVAHDFNNVLAAILGRAQLLKMHVESPQGRAEKRKSMFELKKGLEVIEKASLDGAETVRRIQEFALRTDEDKYNISVNINKVLEDALDFTRPKWKDDAETKGIEFRIQKELSPIPLTTGSASELREVFTNLVNNGLDAMPQGGAIKIKTYREEDHIFVKVEDTGDGIPKTIRDRVFDPFFTTKGVQSSGLGLSVSYGIINRHRGTITVDSVEGERTTFTIKLPVSNSVVEEEKIEPIQIEQRKAKILVIEDEEQVRDLLSDVLINGGHEVETAITGSQGIEKFEKNEFDLVFTDLGMPGMSGWQVAEKIKSINKKVPVALITGWNIELQESEIKKNGVDLIVYKPFQMNQVLGLVQEGMMLRDKFIAA